MFHTALLPILVVSLAGAAAEHRSAPVSSAPQARAERAADRPTASCSEQHSEKTDSSMRPERAILFIIDGLHVDAPERLNLANFQRLASHGTLIERTTVIMPGHPTHGDYARVHTSSFPNPMMMAGTAFLTENQQMLQHSFDHTAFVVNTFAYRSISHDYDHAVQRTESDAFSVDTALDLLARHEDIDFMRIHLQQAGSAGYAVLNAEEGTPWRFNIWHEQSPFVEAVREADRQLGRFADELKQMGKWESTLLVVTSDHGQTDSGWHPLLPEESWLHPSIFLGPGIAQGRVIDTSDQIDLIPTIAHLMGVETPNRDGGAGVVLENVMENVLATSDTDSGTPGDRFEGTSRLLELNRILARQMVAEAKLTLGAIEQPQLNSKAMILERDFYSMDRIMQWHEHGSLEKLIHHNRAIVEQMEALLE